MVPLRLWIRCGNPKAESFFRGDCWSDLLYRQSGQPAGDTAPSGSRQDQRESVQYDGMHTSNFAATTQQYLGSLWKGVTDKAHAAGLSGVVFS